MQNHLASIARVYGQTLIETLVTIVFISVGIIGLIQFQNFLAYDNSIAQQRADATMLASKQIETLRDYQYINNTSGFTSYQGITTGTATTALGNTTYTLSWTVTTNTSPAYKTLDVTVSWPDIKATTQSIRMVANVVSSEPSNAATVL